MLLTPLKYRCFVGTKRKEIRSVQLKLPVNGSFPLSRLICFYCQNHNLAQGIIFGGEKTRQQMCGATKLDRRKINLTRESRLQNGTSKLGGLNSCYFTRFVRILRKITSY